MVFCGCFGQCLRVYFRGGGAAAQADVSTPAAVRNRHDDDCLTVPLMEEVWVHNAQGGWEGGHLTTQVGGAEQAPLEVGAGQMNELSLRQMAQDNIAAPNRESSQQVTSSDFSVFSEATHVQTEGGGGATGEQDVCSDESTEEDTADPTQASPQHEDEDSSTATGGMQAAAGDVDGGGDPPGADRTCAARRGDASPNSILGASNATTPSHSRTASGSESESAAADGEASGGGTAEQRQSAARQKRGLLGSLLLRDDVRGEPSGQQAPRFAEQRLAPQSSGEEYFEQELRLMELWASQHAWSTPQWRECFEKHWISWIQRRREGWHELQQQGRQPAELQQEMQAVRVWLQQQSQDSNYLGALMLMRG